MSEQTMQPVALRRELKLVDAAALSIGILVVLCYSLRGNSTSWSRSTA